MMQVNPYASPKHCGGRDGRNRTSLLYRSMRVFVLAVVGYAAYFAVVAVFVLLRLDVHFSAEMYVYAGGVSFALATSEMFFLQAWSLQESVMRRIGVSSILAILSLAFLQPVFDSLGYRPTYSNRLLIPQIVIAVVIFFVLGMIARVALNLNWRR